MITLFSLIVTSKDEEYNFTNTKVYNFFNRHLAEKTKEELQKSDIGNIDHYEIKETNIYETEQEASKITKI